MNYIPKEQKVYIMKTVDSSAASQENYSLYPDTAPTGQALLDYRYNLDVKNWDTIDWDNLNNVKKEIFLVELPW
jgi:hypothetical protein